MGSKMKSSMDRFHILLVPLGASEFLKIFGAVFVFQKLDMRIYKLLFFFLICMHKILQLNGKSAEPKRNLSNI